MKSSTNIHSLAYFAVLTLIAMSIPLSKFAMSAFEFLLVGLWLWSGFSFTISFRFFKLGGYFKGLYHFVKYFFSLAVNNLVEKFGLFVKNTPALILSSIFLLHLIGLIFTTDFDYALKDMRIKMPLLLFPVIIVTMEKMTYKRFRIMMLLYIASVVAGMIISWVNILKGDFIDIRDVSPFISPVRFSLNVSFAFFILIYFIFYDKWFKNWHKLIFLMLLISFVVFLIMLESVTGLGIVFSISVIYLFRKAFLAKNNSIKFVTLVIAIGMPLAILFYVVNVVKEVVTPPNIDFSQLDKHTLQGNTYYHDTIYHGIEDGRYIGLYLCYEELREEWNKRSKLNIDSLNSQNYSVMETLIRYLTSKDLRKDAQGIRSLTDEDIKMVEQGIANYNYNKNPGLRVRIMKIILGYEVYKETGDPSGSSVMQRYEYSKASFGLIKQNFWLGVGTGDLEDELIAEYRRMGSELKDQYLFHAHNQYIAFFITFGIFGFLWFFFALFYPPASLQGFKDFFFTTFFLIMTFSMLSDDTLETQAGVTLFAFFITFLLFGRKTQNVF